MKYIRIAIDCIKIYDTSMPEKFIIEHYLKSLLLNKCNNVPMIEVKVEEEQIDVVSRSYYVHIAKLLGHKSIRAVVRNGYELLIEHLNDCVIDYDISDELKLESELLVKRHVDLIYFDKELDVLCLEYILSTFGSFVTANNLKIFNLQFNAEEKYAVFDYEMLLMGHSPTANDLYSLHVDWHNRYGIISLNGVKFSTYLR